MLAGLEKEKEGESAQLREEMVENDNNIPLRERYGSSTCSVGGSGARLIGNRTAALMDVVVHMAMAVVQHRFQRCCITDLQAHSETCPASIMIGFQEFGTCSLGPST